MITERALKILEATVQEFIDTGEPVSSAWLYKNHDFGIRPAMIRFELEALAYSGFLEHPYHSAGRVPSDKGYELFARHMIRLPERKPSSEDEMMSDFFCRQEWPELLKAISLKLGILGVACDNHGVYKTGIENLVEKLAWETPDEIRAVMRDFAEIDNRLEYAETFIEETPDVFIGRKNTITKSKNLAVVGGSYETDVGRVMIFAIGPKRMDYKETVKIFKNLKRKTSAAAKKPNIKKINGRSK